ncbi:MAG: PD-(D/E)XK nuclease family protein, partial [Bacteroidaceae bacterium]|nr:PD-(D/E)XK nuclease family protein [Bacteroidaceae bacterium]
ARFRYLFTRLVDTLVRLLKRLGEEFAQSQFEPVAFELPIRMGAEHKPLELFTPDGFRIVVEGVVDRVDVMKKDGIQYVRVVDYKSGSKEFKLSDVYYGLNMQMLIYLFSLCNHFEENNHVHNIPAGVLYMPAKDKVLSADRDTDEKAAKKAQRKQMKMNGILLENHEVLSAMEADLAGIFIPAKTKKDGSFDAHSSLATLSQMGKIKGRVESLIKNLANELHKGNISAAPVDGISRYMPCKWCDYHAICAHEEGDAVRKITEMDRSAILELMRKDENNG